LQCIKIFIRLDNEADALEKAVQDVLNDDLRTKDIFLKEKKKHQHLKWVMQ